MQLFLSCVKRYTPLALSFLRIFLTPFIVLLLLSNTTYSRIMSLILFSIAALSDFFDGFLARRYNATSSFGAFFDPLADKIFITAVFAAFWWKGFIALWMVCALIFRDASITLLRIYASSKGIPFVTAGHGKYKTVAQLIALYALFALCFFSSSPLLFLICNLALYGAVSFTLISGFLYIISNRKLIAVFCASRGKRRE